MSEKLLMIDAAGIRAVLNSMGYHDGDDTCDNCQFFVQPTKLMPNQEGHCCRNAFLVPVREEGVCNFHAQRLTKAED